MSIKIYDAYRFDKNYSFPKLNSLMLNLRRDVAAVAKKEYYKLIMNDFLYYVDFRTIRGKEECKKTYEKITVSSKSDKYLKDIWKILSEDSPNFLYLLFDVEWYNQEKIKIFPTSLSILDSDYDFRCQLVVIPIRGKILALYYGNHILQQVVASQPYLSDYHYQNQTDKPNGIPDTEWRQRQRDWNRALGYDAPSQHGFTVDLLNYTYDLNLLDREWITSDIICDIEHRAKAIVETFDDYPNPPSKEASHSDWVRYTRSEEFKNWKKAKVEEVKLLLKEYSVSDIKDILNTKR